METGGAEVLDELDLTLGVAGSSGNCHSSQPLCTVLEAQSASEHTIARGVLEHVALATAHHIQVAGNHVGPRADVVLRIDYDTGVASSTAGGVDAYSIVEVGSYEAEGVVVAQVLLRGEGNLAEVCQRVDGVGSDAQLPKTLLVER